MCAYRSLNPKDIADLKAGLGLSREGGARGVDAMVRLIGSSATDTLYMSATESFAVLRRLGDVNNYVAFDTEAKGLVYISMNQLLTLSNYKPVRDDLKAQGKLDYIEDQAHGLIVKVLPRSAITKIVIDGKEMKV